jgi:NAD(P)-dependent dehydrogenase (short-subunit alcohol dehydrogenase family)
MSEQTTLHGKVAVVTGAAQGLGQATAWLLAERGAAIVVTDLAEKAGESTAKLIVDNGGEAIFAIHDVASEEGWRQVVDCAMKRFGKVDILVNNAAVVEYGPVNELSVAQFQRVMDVNVKGVFLGCKTILPAMQKAGAGSIINVCSIAGIIANMPGTAAYTTSKGAVRLLTKSVALDYAPYNIRANSIHPGGIATPMAKPYLDNPETAKLVMGRAINNRAAQPREIATVIVFLASDDSSYMNGSEVVADAGWLAH